MNKQCYYEILNVARDASPLDIKTSYRRLAKQIHPDKGSQAEQETNKANFQVLLEAYQVLSNPVERSWYDAHREQILNPRKFTEDFSGFEFDIDALLKGDFIAACQAARDWAPFYARVDEAFEAIRKTEQRACVEQKLSTAALLAAPRFGGEKSTSEELDAFYAYWRKFSTYLSFSWADQFEASKEENRQLRKLAEKENRKLRADARRDYTDSLLSLLQLVRGADPRVIALEVEKRLRQESRLREEKAEKKRIAEQWNELKPQLLEEEMRNYAHIQPSAALEEMLGRRDDPDCFDCLVCEKSFKSENQLKNHNKSKDHAKRHKKMMRKVQGFEHSGPAAAEKGQEPRQTPLTPSLDASPEAPAKNSPDAGTSSPTAEADEASLSAQPANPPAESEDEEPFGGKKGFLKKSTKAKKQKESAAQKKKKATGRTEEPPEAVASDQTVEIPEERIRRAENADDSGAEEVQLSRPKVQNKKELKLKRLEDKKKREALICRLCSNRFESKNLLFKHLQSEHSL